MMPTEEMCTATLLLYNSTSAWMEVDLTNWRVQQVCYEFLFYFGELIVHIQLKRGHWLCWYHWKDTSHLLKLPSCKRIGWLHICAYTHVCIHTYITHCCITTRDSTAKVWVAEFGSVWNSLWYAILIFFHPYSYYHMWKEKVSERWKRA